MSFLRRLFLLVTISLALVQPALLSEQSRAPDQALTLVQSLYKQVVIHHPLGIPEGADGKVFAPYLSNELRHRMDLFRECNADWSQKHADSNLKGPFGLWESGIFSGSDEQAEPRSFKIESAKLEGDGLVRVNVRLTSGTPSERPWIWHVAVILMRESDHWVVKDIIYLRDVEHRGPEDVDSRLSEILARYCDGPRWVGYDKDQSQPK